MSKRKNNTVNENTYCWSTIHAIVSVLSCMILFGASINFVIFIYSQFIHPSRTDTNVFLLFLVDISLVLLFILQHELMSTSKFKELLDFCGLCILKRTIYCLFTAISLQLLVVLWQPIPDIHLWLIDTQYRPLLWLFFVLFNAMAWLVLVLENLMFDPMELLGIQQIYNYAVSKMPPIMYKSQELQQLYGHMRHPGAGLFMMILWIHPLMTLDRIILALGLSLYLYFGHSITHFDYHYVRKELCRETTYTVHTEWESEHTD